MSHGVIKHSTCSIVPHLHTWLVQAALLRTTIWVPRVSTKQVSAQDLTVINYTEQLVHLRCSANLRSHSRCRDSVGGCAQGTGSACCTLSRAAARSRMTGAVTPPRRWPRSSTARPRSPAPAPEDHATSRRRTPSIILWYVSSSRTDLVSKQQSSEH